MDIESGKVITNFPIIDRQLRNVPTAPEEDTRPSASTSTSGRRVLYPDLTQFLTTIHDDGGGGVMTGIRAKIIADAVSYLTIEASDRTAVGKKYKKALAACDHSSKFLTVVGAGCNTTAVVILGIPGLGIVISLALAGVSLGTTLLGGLCNVFSKTFNVKLKKHEDVRVLAVSKLSSVINYISSISGNKELSAQDVKVVLQEIDDYKSRKSVIRKEYKDKHATLQGGEKKDLETLVHAGRESLKRDILRMIENEPDPKTQAGMAKLANRL